MSQSASVPRRLRVAVLNRVFSTTGGGAETYSIRVVEQLAARHEIHVFAQRIEHQWPGVVYHRVPCFVSRPRWINQLWYSVCTWWMTRRGFDVVHSHENTWHGDIQTIHVKPVRGNLLAGLHGWRLGMRWLKIALSPRLIANLSLEAARFRGRAVVPISEALRAQALAAYPAANASMAVITPGVPQPIDDALSRCQARRMLGLPQSETVLLFVANDYARKGLDTLLAAMGRLPAATMLMIVGNPAGIAQYQERTRKLGLAEQVHFIGAMKDVGPAYRAATVLVHPSLDDTFAMVVLEAMSHGLPVVVSGPAYCGISALLQDGRDALLLNDPRDERELAAILARVMGEPALAVRLAEEGRRLAKKHTWEEAARRYEALYWARLAQPR